MGGDTKLWAVVIVWRGLPDSVELFDTKESAFRYKANVESDLTPEDEVAVVSVTQ